MMTVDTYLNAVAFEYQVNYYYYELFSNSLNPDVDSDDADDDDDEDYFQV